jgi:hypothetical protein
MPTTDACADDWDTEYDHANVFANTLQNNTDTIVGEDTVSLVGVDFGTVGAGESRSATFRYLVGDGITSVPPDFTFASASSSGGTVVRLR